MIDRAVSDLVFRDLEPDGHTTRPPAGEAFEAHLREELAKVQLPRRTPRVTPAAEAARFATELDAEDEPRFTTERNAQKGRASPAQ